MSRLNQVTSALACLLLLAWTAWVAREYLEDAPREAWIFVGIGATAFLACGVYCFLPEKLGPRGARWLFLGPAACLLGVAVLPLFYRSGFIAIADQIFVKGPGRPHDAVIYESLKAHLYDMANTERMGLHWACAGFLSAVLAASVASLHFINRPPVRRLRLGLVVGEGVALSPLLYHLSAELDRALGMSDRGRGFRLMLDRLPEMLPALIPAVVLQLLLIKLLPFWQRVGRRDAHPNTRDIHTLGGVLAAGLIGFSFSMVLQINTSVSTLWDQGLVFFGGPVYPDWWQLPVNVLSIDIDPPPVLLMAGALLFALAMLLGMIRQVRHWAGAVAAIVVSLAGASFGNGVLSRHWAGLRDVDEHLGCGVTEFIGAVLERERPRAWPDAENLGLHLTEDDLDVPTSTAEEHLVDVTVVVVSRSHIRINGTPVARVVGGEIIEFEIEASSPLFVPGVYDELYDIALHIKAILARTGGGLFEGEYLLAADRDTPAIVIYQLLHTAGRAGFTRPRLVVREWSPGEEPYCPRYAVVEIDCDPDSICSDQMTCYERSSTRRPAPYLRF